MVKIWKMENCVFELMTAAICLFFKCRDSYYVPMSVSLLKVTDEILERVIYAMENQNEEFYLDLSDGLLKHESDDGKNFIPVPVWKSDEGYRLMERFTESLPKTSFAQRLKDILTTGKGVFRRFKETMHEHPELYEMWENYKYREMRMKALEWLSRWSEALDLENLGPEPEEWDDLPLSDFVFRHPGSDEMTAILLWDREALKERFENLRDVEIQYEIQRERGGAEMVSEELIIVETPSGEFSGFVWIHVEEINGKKRGNLFQIFIIPDLRGFGLGCILMEKALATLADKDINDIKIALSKSGRPLESWLKRNGFQPEQTIWKKRQAQSW